MVNLAQMQLSPFLALSDAFSLLECFLSLLLLESYLLLELLNELLLVPELDCQKTHLYII